MFSSHSYMENMFNSHADKKKKKKITRTESQLKSRLFEVCK